MQALYNYMDYLLRSLAINLIYTCHCMQYTYYILLLIVCAIVIIMPQYWYMSSVG